MRAENLPTMVTTGPSVSHILKQAGISKGAAYYYFENKADRFITSLRESPNSTERRNNAVQAFRRFEDAIMFYEAQ